MHKTSNGYVIRLHCLACVSDFANTRDYAQRHVKTEKHVGSISESKRKPNQSQLKLEESGLTTKRNQDVRFRLAGFFITENIPMASAARLLNNQGFIEAIKELDGFPQRERGVSESSMRASVDVAVDAIEHAIKKDFAGKPLALMFDSTPRIGHVSVAQRCGVSTHAAAGDHGRASLLG